MTDQLYNRKNLPFPTLKTPHDDAFGRSCSLLSTATPVHISTTRSRCDAMQCDLMRRISMHAMQPLIIQYKQIKASTARCPRSSYVAECAYKTNSSVETAVCMQRIPPNIPLNAIASVCTNHPACNGLIVQVRSVPGRWICARSD